MKKRFIKPMGVQIKIRTIFLTIFFLWCTPVFANKINREELDIILKNKIVSTIISTDYIRKIVDVNQKINYEMQNIEWHDSQFVFIKVRLAPISANSISNFNNSLFLSGDYYFVFNTSTLSIYYISLYFWRDIASLLRDFGIYNKRQINDENRHIGIFLTSDLLKLVTMKVRAEKRYLKKFENLNTNAELYRITVHKNGDNR